jgi:uncharacterized protein
MRRLLRLWLIVFGAALIGFAGPVLAQSLFQDQPNYYRTQQPRYQQAPPQYQQAPPPRRNFFDFLFGPRETPQQQQYDEQQQYLQQQQQLGPPVVHKPRPAQLPPAKPTIAKADGATRVAVFGDSLAGDVGKALDRFYADDPTIAILQQAVPASSFARPDYFDWNKTIGEQIAAKNFDVAVVMIGINDRQTINDSGKSLKSLTDDWNTAYSARLTSFLDQLRAANKPVVWVGLPPMAAPQFSAAMTQISGLQRLAVFASGGQFVDIYDKFLDENGDYQQSGPDVNGNQALMRRSDGVHFAIAGADKVAFYANDAIRLVAHGGAGLAVVDPLAGTDAAAMLRPPYQGLGQSKLLQLAGAVIPLNVTPPRAEDLIEAGSPAVASGFDIKQMIDAPVGRADAFGVGVDPGAAKPEPGPAAAETLPTVMASPSGTTPVASAAP